MVWPVDEKITTSNFRRLRRPPAQTKKKAVKNVLSRQFREGATVDHVRGQQQSGRDHQQQSGRDHQRQSGRDHPGRIIYLVYEHNTYLAQTITLLAVSLGSYLRPCKRSTGRCTRSSKPVINTTTVSYVPTR